ncbi:hypothetical protein SAMN04487897_1645 [Paenibacillus sp. yr247]|nr:hypothetical protein SAMN04487897_1645 [Paenibacillus sp. yr247]
MLSFKKPWAIAGGWSIDLFLGKATRDHDDIEIIIYRTDQLVIREYLNDWNFNKVQNGIITPWKRNEILVPPIHETYAEKGFEKIEILLNESNAEYWIYRRDTRIQREFNKTILTTNSGIPFLSPEITLLYKSKNPRPKDEIDFRNIYEYMSIEQKQWLQYSLKLIYTEHPWIELLS